MGCRGVPRVVLSEIFRQRSDGSGSEDIARNAQLVNSGKLPVFFRNRLFAEEHFKDGNDDRHFQEDDHDKWWQHEYVMNRKSELFDTSFSDEIAPSPSEDSGGHVLGPHSTASGLFVNNGCVMLTVNDAQEAADQLIDTVTQLLATGRLPSEIQVLSPMKRGPCGTLALNGRLQPLLNPNHKPSQHIAAGDRVLQLVNDYDRNVFNGDMGVVASIHEVTTPFLCVIYFSY